MQWRTSWQSPAPELSSDAISRLCTSSSELSLLPVLALLLPTWTQELHSSSRCITSAAISRGWRRRGRLLLGLGRWGGNDLLRVKGGCQYRFLLHKVAAPPTCIGAVLLHVATVVRWRRGAAALHVRGLLQAAE
eukprot:COSAG01_NODE_3767_length_5718_cov_4.404342_10_plen_134_part_00